MKNAIILHGTGETPDNFWFPWIKSQLQSRGYQVSIPQLPDTDNPDLKAWLPASLKETYTEETVLIGHSAGGPLILSILENIPQQINQAVFVAGFFEPLAPLPFLKAILQTKYDWQKISEHAKDFVFINSDNDPWGCDDKQGRAMLENVGKGTLIIPKGQGHMGSDSFKQPYKEFPLLLKLID